ncbi:MAG: hypothetical protein RL217_789 [Pseudomonadota bacterium]|jgi:D-amino-acid dehydrogenase
MRVLVLGAGVIGTTSAYYLAKAGMQVTVLERQAGVAEETSFANAGQLSYGYSSPWAAPNIPLQALQWLMQQHGPLRIGLTASLAQYRWLWQMLRNCTSERYTINKERMVRVAEYSHHCLKLLREENNLDYEGRSLGVTQLFRTKKQLQSSAQDMAILERFSVPFRLLKPEEIAEVEPALASRSACFTGALNLPQDESGDCRIFTQKLASLAASLGVDYRFNHHIQRLEIQNNKVQGVWAEGKFFQADCYVLALGSYSPLLLTQTNLQLPVYPLKGYSLTLPILDESKAVRSTILDESYKVAMTRFNSRIRIGGMAEIRGHNLALYPRREETLLKVFNDLFPGSADTKETNFWTGLRPATPDGTPIIGATAIENLFINTGHGTLGWTMSCGSGKLLADIISGKPTEIALDGLGVGRYLAT